MSVMEPVVYCWGCNKLIIVPFTEDNKPAELFKCGWCEGINNLQHQTLANIPHLQQQQQLGQTAPQCVNQWQHHNGALMQNHHQPSLPQHHAGIWHQQYREQPLDFYSQQQSNWQQEQNWQPAVWQATRPPVNGTEKCATDSTKPTRPDSWRSRCCSCWGHVLRAWRWLVVLVVMLLVGSVTWCGVILLLPLVCTTWTTFLPNAAFGLLLVFQISFNYTAAVLRPAGRVADHATPPLKTPDGCVAQGSLQHWSWCHHCQAAKPPLAHHCRACGECVVKMDHHCPFINNCVGAGNLRSFLLFLTWTLLAAVYILLMCSLLVWQNWDVVKASIAASSSNADSTPTASSMQQTPVLIDNLPGSTSGSAGSAPVRAVSANSSRSVLDPVPSPDRSSRGRRPVDVWLIASTGVFFLVLQASPWWLLVAYYMVAVSLALLVALGMLLGSQLYYLGRGVAYIDHLKGLSQAGTQQQQVQLRVDIPGCWGRVREYVQLTWARWWEVLGVAPLQQSTSCDMLRALVVPHWCPPAAAALKKWS